MRELCAGYVSLSELSSTERRASENTGRELEHLALSAGSIPQQPSLALSVLIYKLGQ